MSILFALILGTLSPETDAEETRPEDHYRKAQAAMMEKEYRLAEDQFRLAYKLDSTNVNYSYNLGKLAFARSDTGQGRLWLNRCLALLGYKKGADHIYKRLAKELPANPVAVPTEPGNAFDAIKHKALGANHLDLKRHPEAEADLLISWKNDSENPETARLLWRLYHETADFERALDWYVVWKDLSPGAKDRNRRPEIREKPVLTRSEPPLYPRKARERGITGNVIIKFRVSKFGRVDTMSVLKGHELLRKEAMRTVLRFRFKPAITVTGDSVSVWMTQSIVFR